MDSEQKDVYTLNFFLQDNFSVSVEVVLSEQEAESLRKTIKLIIKQGDLLTYQRHNGDYSLTVRGDRISGARLTKTNSNVGQVVEESTLGTFTIDTI